MASAPRHSFAMIAVPLAIAAAALTARSARRAPALPVYGPVPVFSLIDHEGRAISTDTLRGAVWVADFIFTRCAGQCPIMSRQMAHLARRFAAAPDVRWLSVTVDPEWDTVPVLARYAASYTSDSRWRFVTGDRGQIERLCRDGFRLSLRDSPGTPEEPITHSVRLVLVDRAGVIRGSYQATDPAQSRQLIRDLAMLLRERR